MSGACAGLLALTSMMHAAFAYGENTAEIIGGSGLPIPPQSYVDAVNGLYIDPAMPFPGQPVYPGFTPQALFTPEGLYPLTGIKDLPTDISLDRGVTILNDAITPQIDAGKPTLVFGFSQSSVISTLEMRALDPSGTPSPLSLSFVLTGDPANPNGGILERFDGLSFPSLGFDFSGATPDNDFPTTIYTIEYDGFADFPRYPIDLPADLNALAGIYYVHGTYSSLTPAEVATAVPLTTEAPTLTQYFMIPTENLPLLDPLRSIPVVGNPLADLIQPDLKTIVNLGYGDPTFGYSTAPANVPTPFGLFPNVDPTTVLSGLVTGTEQGISNAISDIESPPPLLPVPNPISVFGTALSPAAGGGTPTDIVNTLSSVIANDYAVLLPTSDIALALATRVPAYDVSLFVSALEAGNPVDAVGYPIAADTGLVAVAAGFEGLVLLEAAATTVSDLLSLLP